MTASVGARWDPVEDTCGAYATARPLPGEGSGSDGARGGLEPQAAAAVRGDQGGPARVVAELAAQPAQMHVDGLRAGVERRLPHALHQLPARHDVAGPGHEGVQELELLAGQPDLAVASPDPSRRGV